MAKNKKTILEKELALLEKREQCFLKKNITRKESFLNQQLARKVPEKLQSTLNLAFSKAFHLVFDKGTGIIEKAYPKGQVEFNYKMNTYATELRENRKTLRAFQGRAKRATNKNLLLTSAEGIGLGLLGIGLPDIPLFTAMILKSLYEIAGHYGYSCQTEEEKYFILKLIQGALSFGDGLIVVNHAIDTYIDMETLPADYQREAQILDTSGTLSSELLYMKFLQGIPIAGIIGGAYDTFYLKKITDYARLKYQRRFLVGRIRAF